MNGDLHVFMGRQQVLKRVVRIPNLMYDKSYVYSVVPTLEYDEERYQTPCQRATYDATGKGAHLHEPIKSVPTALLIVLLGLYLLLAYLTQLVEDDMPKVVNESDVARDNSVTFSEEAAWRYIHIIQGTEPRVTGTKYHLKKTKDLKELLDSVAEQSNLPIRTDWQMVTGDYWLSFVNLYQNVSNIIALLEGESGFLPNGTIGTSLLVNCHYDSVPFALGTSDDAIFCAAMIETLSKLSRRSQKLRHNVIFLFNGAEENGLQASHAFLKHEWAKGVTNVVNLDSAGMNGKPIIFQASDPRLLSMYQSVVNRPNAQSVGEFMFANGIIPSDTDFRIWRDFGDIHGIDIAFSKWGHVYHTRYDCDDFVKTGVVQNAGNMLLALVPAAAGNAELETKIEPSVVVYFDFLNWFLVSYTYGASVAVDLLVALFACLTVAYYVWLVGLKMTTVQELLFAMLGRVLSTLAGILIVAIFVLIMVATTVQLRYLAQPWLVVPMYWLPYAITAVCVAQAFDAWRTKRSGLNRCIRTMQAQAATRSILAFILIIMTCIPSTATLRYFVTVPLFIISLMSLASLTVIRYVRLQAWQHLLMEVLWSVPSTMFVLTLALRLCALMLPIMGRNGSNAPDYLIAIINTGIAAIVLCTVSGIELLFSRKRLWMVVAPVAITCIVLMFIPFSPYQDDGPSVQRHYWFHSEIISYDYNNAETDCVSGIVVTKIDAYSTSRVLPALREKGINLESRTDFADDCQRYVLCNLPLGSGWLGRNLVNALFLYTGPPAPFVPDNTLTVQNKTCSGSTCIFDFVMIAPAQNLITIRPHANVNLTSWTFDSPARPTFIQDSRLIYLIYHSRATYSDVFAPLQFNVTLSVPAYAQSQPIMDVALHSHLNNHPEEFTQEYRNILNAVPKYFNIATSLSRRKNYVF
ncbi:endoplasmic reticulum metallopeptidase 1-like [Hyposmocoma kahamanoa]|uniref:endoplasmic reticulum metallopeptidase 1-like n=1 Tax=Hyposmocoma kahamanoa TaxID=1477025 RepID=UPI000E6D7C03|nr:endoplasmic reticulum metallopeptidase 1-like [Hyposmocoma kahamanoa]